MQGELPLSSWKRDRGYNGRTTGSRGKPRQSILIVSEGTKTEPQYFESFRVSSVEVIGTGFNTDSLVQYAVDKKNAARPAYDQVWCVFDRDSFTAQDFNRALQLANSNGIKVAYSNEAFELWYLLHFNYYDTGLPRADYKAKLTANLGYEYKKNDRGIYNALLCRQSDAIRNAKRLLAVYNPHSPERDNPSTLVHELVEMLNGMQTQ
jgi:hypothetical protein